MIDIQTKNTWSHDKAELTRCERSEQSCSMKRMPFGYKKTLKERIDGHIKASPLWIISLLSHGVIIILMMQIVIREKKEEPEYISVITEVVPPKNIPKPEKIKPLLETQDIIVKDMDVDITEVIEPLDEVVELVIDPVVLDDMDEMEPSENISDEMNMNVEVNANDLAVFSLGTSGGSPSLGSLGNQRSTAQRSKTTGGNPSVVPAVDRGLAYLARVQNPKGFWTGNPEHTQANAITDHAVTGLALLCFLGSGHTERMNSPYKKNVVKAVDYLLSVQKEDGSFASHNMYMNGICAMALAESVAMGGRAKTRIAAQKSIDFICRAQNKSGSWGYAPQSEKKNDTSVAGWQMMAIKSAKMAHLKVSDHTIRKALAAFDRATTTAKGDFKLHYSVPHKGHATGGTPTMTLVGMCIKEFFGMKKSHQELSKPALLLLKQKYYPTPIVAQGAPGGNKANGYYALYYGALVNFQMGGKYWRKWKDAMVDFLIPTQDISGTKDDGSWDHTTVGKDHQHGWESLNRTGITCFNILSLEVFWRYSRGRTASQVAMK